MKNNKNHYSTPYSEIIEIKNEGFICQSPFDGESEDPESGQGY